MSEELVSIRIPTAREKLKSQFPEDPRGDFTLIFKSKVFRLQKPYLRLDSGFFKKICTSQTNSFEIKQDFNEDFFSNIMYCFYGGIVNIHRSEIHRYYPIAKFLEIQSILNTLKKDLIQNIDQYELFLVLKIAHKYTEQDLYETCLDQLERESFEQLKIQTYGLLDTEPALFKLIINMHNRHKVTHGTGLSYVEIDQLLRKYCQSKNLQEGKYHEFKFQLIEKTSLNSKEYKQIFLDEAVEMNKISGLIQKQPENQISQKRFMTSLEGFSNLSESIKPNFGMMSSPNFGKNTKVANKLTLEMEITFQKKLNRELEEQNNFLRKELQNLMTKTVENTDIHAQMQNQLETLKQELKKKQVIEKENKKKMVEFEAALSFMEKEIAAKIQIIDKLWEKFEDIKNHKPLMDSLQEVTHEDYIAQSQFLPGNLIGEMLNIQTLQKQPQGTKTPQKPESTIKQQNQSIDEIELEQTCLMRFEFNVESVSTPKYHIPKLISFICAEDFNKKKLKLIFRRSNTVSNIGNNSDIRQKNKLLILIKTTTQQNIGGYISVPIPAKCDDYICDPNAMIFSLTKNAKFEVKKQQKNDAIFMSDYFLVSFANDLMISNNCLTEESNCSWPSSYEGLQKRGALWLVGGSDFYIDELEIYEIEEEQMQMNII